MKLSRIFTYAAVGVIAGLLIENQAILAKQAAERKARKLKDEAKKMMPGKD